LFRPEGDIPGAGRRIGRADAGVSARPAKQ
jgi:hypothetical protein